MHWHQLWHCFWSDLVQTWHAGAPICPPCSVNFYIDISNTFMLLLAGIAQLVEQQTVM